MFKCSDWCMASSGSRYLILGRRGCRSYEELGASRTDRVWISDRSSRCPPGDREFFRLSHLYQAMRLSTMTTAAHLMRRTSRHCSRLSLLLFFLQGSFTAGRVHALRPHIFIFRPRAQANNTYIPCLSNHL